MYDQGPEGRDLIMSAHPFRCLRCNQVIGDLFAPNLPDLIKQHVESESKQ